MIYGILKNVKSSDNTDENVVISAAKSIKDEIDNIKLSEHYFYPTNQDIYDLEKNNKVVPDTLQLFMKQLISNP